MIAPSAFADPPSRIGRIDFVDGDVSFYAERAEGWRKAQINFPVTSKNSIWVNGAGRAEVRVGASALRVDADSILDFTQIDDSSTRLFLQRGTLNLRMRGFPASQDPVDRQRESKGDNFLVDTNDGAFTLQANGRYRVDAGGDRNETRISVFAGLARFSNPGSTLNIEAGKSLIVRAENGTTSFTFESANESQFDRWAEARDMGWDQTHQRYASERRISPHMTGYEDLDTYGDWVDDDDYGRLWAPRALVTGWAPYRYGSWSYVRPWGWTWIDDAAWGFAPFHYGRWVHRQARWYWWPGAYSYRPVYAPALVGWYGSGNWNVSLSLGGSIGWFPLAPHEHFVPQYTTNITYIRNINNITNNVTIVNRPTRFANHVHGGTFVNNGVMVNGESVWRNAVNNHQPANMTKPAVDSRSSRSASASPNFGVTTIAPPAAPPMMHSRVIGSPSVGAVNGESPRVISSSQPPLPVNRTSVVGEAPRPQPAHTKPAELHVPSADHGSTGQQHDTGTIPAFAKPVKPNPVAVRSAPQNVAPAVQPQPTSPMPRYEVPSAISGKPVVTHNEQRVDGPVRMKDRSDRGARGEVGDSRQPGTRSEQSAPQERKPNSQVSEKPQNSGGKIVHQNNAGSGETNNKITHQ